MTTVNVHSHCKYLFVYLNKTESIVLFRNKTVIKYLNVEGPICLARNALDPLSTGL